METVTDGAEHAALERPLSLLPRKLESLFEPHEGFGFPAKLPQGDAETGQQDAMLGPPPRAVEQAEGALVVVQRLGVSAFLPQEDADRVA